MFASPLLHYRLRWYAVSTARLLLRRWQASGLILGLVSAAGTTVFDNVVTLAHPLLALLAPGHGAAWRFAYLLALQAVAAVWAAMQRAQIGGGPFMAFAGSLPFSPRQRRHVDLAVLLLADSPLLLVVGAALTVTAARHVPARLPHLLLLGDIVLLAMASQAAVLERRRAGAVAVIAACAVLAGAFGTQLAYVATALVGVAAVLALWRGPAAETTRAAAARTLRWRMPSPPSLLPLLSAIAGRHAPALLVALAILLRERRDEALAKALVAGVLAAAALGLVDVFERDARSFATVLIAQGLVALTLSGLFRGLHLAHRASADVIGALPLPGNWSRGFDLAVVLGFGLPFLGGLAGAAWAMGAAPAAPLAAAALSFAVLLCALRAPQLVHERHAVVLGTALAGGWTAATIAWLH